MTVPCATRMLPPCGPSRIRSVLYSPAARISASCCSMSGLTLSYAIYGLRTTLPHCPLAASDASDLAGVIPGRIDRVARAQLLSEAQPVVADVRGDDHAGACGAGHRCREQPRRAATGDQHRLPGEVLHERRVDGIAQRFLQAGELRWDLP